MKTNLKHSIDLLNVLKLSNCQLNFSMFPSENSTLLLMEPYSVITTLNPNKGNVWNPCQVQGVVAATTTIYLGSGAKFSSKIMFASKMTSIPTYLEPF